MTTTLKEMMAAARAIAPQEASKLLSSGQAIALEVREADEVVATGEVRGAVNAGRGHLEFSADAESPRYDPTLRNDMIILVYRGSGARESGLQDAE
jgi:hypothetical protein